MQLLTFASAWAFGSFAECRRRVELGLFDGIEGPPPTSLAECKAQRTELAAAGVPFIAEVCTGGDYAPASSVPATQHLQDFAAQLERAAEAGALFATCLAGSDSWPQSEAIDFFARASELGRTQGVTLSFETHRGRPTNNPWATQRILQALPELRLTCDLSHWCVVCERLPDDEAALSLALSRARHIHARVGYAQGPQVPDPRAPEYSLELEAHERWWDTIWQHARAQGRSSLTLTPEFGPDGYLQCLPYSGMPVADLAAINVWMAQRQKQRWGGASSAR
jgi:sugar phosphate isomerase/epimerase